MGNRNSGVCKSGECGRCARCRSKVKRPLSAADLQILREMEQARLRRQQEVEMECEFPNFAAEMARVNFWKRQGDARVLPVRDRA